NTLALYLIAPDGTQIVLAQGNGGSGADFTNTTFDDEASTSISSGSAPFSGSYQPLGLLAALQGKNVKGTWTLRVTNTYGQRVGKIPSWSLIVTRTSNGNPVAAPPTAALSAQSNAGVVAAATFALAPGNTNPQDIADPPGVDMLLPTAATVDSYF